MGESQDSFLTQETMTTSAAAEKGAQKGGCCQWNRKTMSITMAISIALVLCLVALIIRFHANVRPDEKYASVGTIPFPAVTICPGIRSGYPKNNFNRTLFLMQTEAQPKLRPRKYEGHTIQYSTKLQCNCKLLTWIFCCCCLFRIGKLHWKPCFNYATGISFDGYEIGTFWNVMWIQMIKLKLLIQFHAILMKMLNFVHGIDAPHVMNTFDRLSPMKDDVTHL